jgi:hypothetical protein
MFKIISLSLCFVFLSGCVLTKVITVPMRVGGAVISVIPVVGGAIDSVVDTTADAIDLIPI